MKKFTTVLAVLTVLFSNQATAQSAAGTAICHYEDTYIEGSLGVGFNINCEDDLYEKTLYVSDFNIRVYFDDASSSSGTFANNDWEIEINGSGNTSSGATNHFAIRDSTGGTVPFKIMAGAPDNSLYTSADGNIGIGTNTPSARLRVDGDIKIGYSDAYMLGGYDAMWWNSTSGGTIIGTTDPGGSVSVHVNGAMSHRFDETGNVGIGTLSPTAKLDVAGDIHATGDANIDGELYVASENGYMHGGSVGSNFYIESAANLMLRPGRVLTGGYDVMIYDMSDNVYATFEGTDGNVGLNTSTPQERLDVNGKIRMREDAMAGYILEVMLTEQCLG